MDPVDSLPLPISLKKPPRVLSPATPKVLMPLARCADSISRNKKVKTLRGFIFWLTLALDFAFSLESQCASFTGC